MTSYFRTPRSKLAQEKVCTYFIKAKGLVDFILVLYIMQEKEAKKIRKESCVNRERTSYSLNTVHKITIYSRTLTVHNVHLQPTA